MKDRVKAYNEMANNARELIWSHMRTLGLEESLEAQGIARGIENLRKIPSSDHVLMGSTYMFFTMMHVTCIRVELRDDESVHGEGHRPKILCALDEEWQEEVDHLYDLAQPDGHFATTQIPGMEGEWLVFVYPSTR